MKFSGNMRFWLKSSTNSFDKSLDDKIDEKEYSMPVVNSPNTARMNDQVRSQVTQIAKNEVKIRVSHKMSPAQMGDRPRILITGGAGNVGSNLALHLRNCGYWPIALDNMTSGHKIATDISYTDLLKVDLENFDDVDAAIAHIRPQAVIHAGAYIAVGEGQANPWKYYNGNLNGGINLALAMAKNNVRRLLFSNTAAVLDGTLNRELSETDPWMPSSHYGWGKALLSNALKNSGLGQNISMISLHYFNVCGAPESMVLREDHGIGTETHLIPVALQVAMYNLLSRYGMVIPGYDSDAVAQSYKAGGRDKAKVFGNNYNTPDHTCIRDYVNMDLMLFFHQEALCQLLQTTGRSYRGFHLGTKTGNSVFDVINTAERVVRRIAGLAPLTAIQESDILSEGRVIPATIETRRPGDSDFLVAVADKARAELAGGKTLPDSSLEKTIERAFWSMIYRPMGYGQFPSCVKDSQEYNDLVRYYRI